jgi:hypothetical protein
MRKILTIPVLILALIFGGLSSAPARADHEIARALLGAAVVGLAVKAFNDQKKRERQKQAYHKRQKDAFHDVPKRCLRQRWTHGGWVTYADERCVDRFKHDRRHHDRYVNRRHNRYEKPRECLRKRWTPRGWESFYAERCLERHGF